jgi:fructosamine-3-kinase
VTVPPELAAAVGRAAGAAVTGGRRVSGGSINEAWALELDGGRRAFVKSRRDAEAVEYETEAAGLAWLAEPGALRVPAVLGAGGGDPAFLALEWIEEGQLDAVGEEELGRGLASLHAAGAPAFGAPPGTGPLRIGPLVLPNDPAPDWPGFYAEQRLHPLLAPAADGGALSGAGVRAVERVCETADELAGPPEPPARLHGDLWSGNVLGGADGRPWLVDPAAYGGHREVDLAMLRLFGDPGPRVLGAYAEAAPLADGHEERLALWQLFPLLVHTVLFGGSYGARAEQAALSALAPARR